MVLLRTKATAGSSLVAYKSLNCLSFFQFASEMLGVQIGHIFEDWTNGFRFASCVLHFIVTTLLSQMTKAM